MNTDPIGVFLSASGGPDGNSAGDNTGEPFNCFESQVLIRTALVFARKQQIRTDVESGREFPDHLQSGLRRTRCKAPQLYHLNGCGLRHWLIDSTIGVAPVADADDLDGVFIVWFEETPITDVRQFYGVTD